MHGSTTITCRKAKGGAQSEVRFTTLLSLHDGDSWLWTEEKETVNKSALRVSTTERTTLYDRILPTNRDLLQVWELPIADEGQTLGTLRSAF